jgi:hypothetical protein
MCPPTKTAKFGIPRTLYRDASSGDFSVSTFSTTTRPARSRATCATWGAAILHGPHHAAQKSTSIGTLLSRTISSNSSRPTSTGSAIGGSVVLQAPHLPVSAKCLAGIRFGLPQDGQFRVIAMEKSLIEFPPPQYLAGEAIAANRESAQAIRPSCAGPILRTARPARRVRIPSGSDVGVPTHCKRRKAWATRIFPCPLPAREITCFARIRSTGVHAYVSRRKYSTDATLVSGSVE